MRAISFYSMRRVSVLVTLASDNDGWSLVWGQNSGLLNTYRSLKRTIPTPAVDLSVWFHKKKSAIVALASKFARIFKTGTSYWHYSIRATR